MVLLSVLEYYMKSLISINETNKIISECTERLLCSLPAYLQRLSISHLLCNLGLILISDLSFNLSYLCTVNMIYL